MNPLYCTLYVNHKCTHDEMLCIVEEELKSKHENCFVTGRLLDVFVDRNEDFDADTAKLDDGFLYYPFRFEIEPSVHEDEDEIEIPVNVDEFKEQLRDFLIKLTAIGMYVVPSCDYEEFLNLRLGN